MTRRRKPRDCASALFGDDPSLELVEMRVHEFRHAGVVFHVEQGEPGVGGIQIAYDVARSRKDTAGRSAGRNQHRLGGRVVDHRFTCQPVGEVRDWDATVSRSSR